MGMIDAVKLLKSYKFLINSNQSDIEIFIEVVEKFIGVYLPRQLRLQQEVFRYQEHPILRTPAQEVRQGLPYWHPHTAVNFIIKY